MALAWGQLNKQKLKAGFLYSKIIFCCNFFTIVKKFLGKTNHDGKQTILYSPKLTTFDSVAPVPSDGCPTDSHKTVCHHSTFT